MPVTPTYPGIYIQEAPSTSHTVIAAPTNIAVFIGYTHPLKTDAKLWGQAVQIFGWPDYVRQFGGYVRSAAFANQAFNIADHVKVTSAGMEDGMLAIALVREVPEQLKPRKIEIGNFTSTAANQQGDQKQLEQTNGTQRVA